MHSGVVSELMMGILYHPIVLSVMRVGFIFNELAGCVSRAGALGVVALVVGYHEKIVFINRLFGEPMEAVSFCFGVAPNVIFKNVRNVCKMSPLEAGVSYSTTGYGRVADDVCETVDCISLRCRGVGGCIADGLGRAHVGDTCDGLYFGGSNVCRIDRTITAKELADELMQR